MRSFALGRLGKFCEAAEDAERALKEKKNLKVSLNEVVVIEACDPYKMNLILAFPRLSLLQTHSRAAFAYLDLALHHFRLAKEEELSRASSTKSPEPDFDALIDQLSTSKKREFQSAISRCPTDLFVKMISLCDDAPSTAIASRTSKIWNKSINNSIEIFQDFKMEGCLKHSVQGVKQFASKSKNSIRRVTLKSTSDLERNEFNYEERDFDNDFEQLKVSLEPSCQTIRSLSYDGDRPSLFLPIAFKCKSLKRLYINGLGNSHYISFPSAWKPQFDTFVWSSQAAIDLDDALLDRLQEAREVRISARRYIRQDWIVKLLSSDSKIKRLHLDAGAQQGIEIDIPIMDVPNLTCIHLNTPPESRSSTNSDNVFKNLNAPNLEELHFETFDESVGLQNLSFLNPDFSPIELKIRDVNIQKLREDEDDEGDYELQRWKHLENLRINEQLAFTFFTSIHLLRRLKNLEVRLSGSDHADLYVGFCKILIKLLTPLSKESMIGYLSPT